MSQQGLSPRSQKHEIPLEQVQKKQPFRIVMGLSLEIGHPLLLKSFLVEAYILYFLLGSHL